MGLNGGSMPLMSNVRPPFAGKPRSYRDDASLVGARLAREGTSTATIEIT
jgi:hypothetical protein